MMFSKKLLSANCRLVFNRGFTVMELLVVMAIMGILYTVVMSSVGDSRSKGRDSKRIADISLIQLILEKYYDEEHKYPSSLDELFAQDSSFSKKDPQDIDYKYTTLNSDKTSCDSSSSKCQSYHLGATLENNNSVLEDDEDKNIIFNGEDSEENHLGCGSEPGKYCYDVIPKF